MNFVGRFLLVNAVSFSLSGSAMLGMKFHVIRSFRKCGISLPIDGSEDCEINIKGIEDYEVRNGGSDAELDGEVTDIDLEDGGDPFVDM